MAVNQEQEWDWPPPRRRRRANVFEEAPPKSDLGVIADNHQDCQRLHSLCLFCFQNGARGGPRSRDLRRALAAHSDRFAGALILGRRFPWRRGWRSLENDNRIRAALASTSRGLSQETVCRMHAADSCGGTL